MTLFLLWCGEDVKGGLKSSAPQSPSSLEQNNVRQTRQNVCVVILPAEVHGAGVCLCGHLEEELRKLREETNVDSLRQELDRERSKRLELEQKMNEVVKSRWESVHADVSTWKSSEYYPNRSVTASKVNRAPLVSRSAHWRGSFRTKEHPQSARKFLLTEEMTITLVIPRCNFSLRFLSSWLQCSRILTQRKLRNT